VEAHVNGWVAAAQDTVTQVLPLDEARAAGATAMFGEKYEDVVSAAPGSPTPTLEPAALSPRPSTPQR
jgi:hypothetical protein